MKKFFTELTEVLSTVALSSCFIYLLFKYVIGTPDDIKSMGSNIKKIDTKVSNVIYRQDFIDSSLDEIETTQLDVSQRLYDNNYLIKENNEQLQQLQKDLKIYNYNKNK